MSQVSPNLLIHLSAQGRLAIHERDEKGDLFLFGQRTESLFVHLSYLFLIGDIELMNFLAP